MMAIMKPYLAVLVVCLLAGRAFAQPETAQFEERLAAATDSERIELLGDLAELYRTTDPGRTVELGTEALSLIERFPDSDLELGIANSLAHALGSLSRYREALEHAKRAEELARGQDDPSALAFAMSRAGYAYRKLGDNAEALTHYDAALPIYEELGERVNVAFCLTGRCRIRWRTGKYEPALKDCLDAYGILEELGDADEQTTALNHLGLAYDDLGHSEEALGYYKRALDLQQENGDKVLVSRLLNNIGAVYHQRGEFDRCLEYYSRSLAIKEELGDQVGVSRRLTSIGNVYQEFGQLDQARGHYQSALAAAREVGFKIGAILAAEGLASIDAKQDRPGDAIALLKDALEIAAEIGEPQPYIYLRMSETYASMGRFREALAAHQEFERITSTALKEENSRNMTEMLARFDTDQKKKKIELLEQQQAFAALELERQRNSRQALLVGFGLTLTILLITFNRYRLKARAVAMEQTIDRERTVSARLREVDRLKDEFLANTSHELRTPLYGITGLAESLIDGASGELPAKTKTDLSIIVASGRRLGHLVNDILDFSKLKHHSLELDAKPVDLCALVEFTLALLRPLISSKTLKLVNAVASDSPLVLGDENRLQQILHNLIGNAIKFTEEGKIEITAVRRDDRLVVSVRDTGIGISQDLQERIFEAFTQADGTTEREFGGTGLGLAVTRQLLALHGGTLGVESTPGAGSTFTFDLPVAQEDAPLSVPVPPSIFCDDLPLATTETEPLMGEGTASILVVDDEHVIRHVLVNQLAAEGYHVAQAASGPEALAQIEEQPPDLLLLDVMMPRMSGYEVCRALRGRFSIDVLPVLFLTAKSLPSDPAVGLAAGANDYLRKPISKSELLARVSTHLALRAVNHQLSELVIERTSEVEERERLLEERQLLVDQLETRNADLARFNYTVAHDLKNPLTTINNFLGLARHDAAQGETSRLEDDFNRLQGATNKLRQLLDELFEFSRSSLEPNSPEETDFGALVNSASTLLGGPIAERRATIEVAHDLPSVRGDRPRLEALVRHLIRNALRYVDDGKSPEIEIGAQMEGGELIFYVRDNGIGIDPKYHEKIFDLFERLNPEGTEGTGIGLALAKQTVEAHGGRIWVESQGLGLGSTFRFVLPWVSSKRC